MRRIAIAVAALALVAVLALIVMLYMGSQVVPLGPGDLISISPPPTASP